MRVLDVLDVQCMSVVRMLCVYSRNGTLQAFVYSRNGMLQAFTSYLPVVEYSSTLWHIRKHTNNFIISHII